MPTTTAKLLFAEQYAPTVVGSVYQAVNCKTIIDKFTGANQTAANVLISVHLVPSGGSPSNANRVVKERGIAPGETYTFPELIGKQLDPSGTIQTVCDTATALVIGANGREITA